MSAQAEGNPAGFERTAHQTEVVMAITAVTSLVGFAREVAFADRFGTGASADAWGSAAVILAVVIDLLLFAGPLSTVVVPALAERRLLGEAASERRALSALLIAAGTAGMLAALVMVLGAGTFAGMLAPGFSGERRRLLTALLAYIGAAVAPMALAGVLAAAQSSRHRFATPAFMGLALHIPILLSLVWLVPASGIMAVGAAVVVGALLQLVLQAPALRTPGLSMPPDWTAVSGAARWLVPVLAVSALRESTLVLERVFASTLPTGELAILYFAGKLEQFPLGLFATTVAVVAYPAFTELAVGGRHGALGEAVARSMRMVLLLAVPSAIGLAVLAQPIVRLLFGHGAFGPASVETTAVVLFPMSFGLVGQSLIPCLLRGFFSLKEMRVPRRVLTAVTILNLGLDAVLVRLGAIGLATAFAITMTSAMIGLGLALARRVQFSRRLELGRLAVRLAGAGTALGLAAWAAHASLDVLLGHSTTLTRGVATFGAIAIGVGVYAAALRVGGVEELDELAERLKTRLYRRAPAADS